ncbi:LysR family transcriptional regulator [Cupriavidus pauculus]|uniref:LysR family transcriptional regulator n=1 Tax=Cupriavidus pauculus TaxID=82633 RepID=A0A2N5C3C2_9BURK|nr:LysR family transcriptional regulator [Cupriavidus pauculus]PLP96716.1 LysR family transcriptional regulator [Cupriavidus pauculus]
MDYFQAMKVFVRVVEAGSFTKVASDLGISRGSATILIKQLESHLGARLLQRTTRQVTPTLDGSAYYQHCLNILAEMEEAESVFSQSASHPRGRLKVDLPTSLARLVVIPALPDFYARFPTITLEVGVGDRMIDLVAEGVDCVVRLGALADSTLVARNLPALTQVTCASSDYVARFGQPSTLEELEGHECVEFLSINVGRLQPLEFCCDDRIELRQLRGRITARHGESYVSAGEAGLGIIQVPLYHVASQLRAGTLLELLPQYPPPKLPITVLYPHHRHLTPRLRVFIDWLVSVFSSDIAASR